VLVLEREKPVPRKSLAVTNSPEYCTLGYIVLGQTLTKPECNTQEGP
jgi:hypothetical protein